MARTNPTQAKESKDATHLVRLCLELDREMDGVKVPAAAAAILNGIRSWLLENCE